MKKLYNHYFPTPEYLAMNSYALDISDQSIKFGELVPTSSGLHLGNYGKEKIEEGVVVSGKIENDQKLISILKNLKNKYKINFVRVSLPEEQMYLFNLSLPKLEPGKIREAILLQIEEHVPLKAEDINFDYVIIKENKDNIFVEVSAISLEILESYSYVLRSAGLTPLSFEIEAEAIARAVVKMGDDKPVMIVDFGDTRTGVFISYNGDIFLTTTLSLGGSNITNMIAKSFNVSFEEAENMKKKYGIDGDSKVEDIFPIIINGISVLRDEILKQYNYWKEHQKDLFVNDPISKIVLCGGDSNLVGLSDYLSISLGIKVEHADAWTNITDMKNTIPDMTFEESLSYTTVLGLALGDYLYRDSSVMNVLPKDEKKKIRKEYKKRLFTMLLNITAVFGIMATLLLTPTYFFSKSKENLAEKRLEDFNRENPDINNNFDSVIKEINDKLVLLDSGNLNNSIYNELLLYLLEIKPDGVSYSQIIYSKKAGDKKASELKSIEIRGMAKDRLALRNFKDKLDSNDAFSEVDIPVSSFLEKSDLNFNISIILK